MCRSSCLALLAVLLAAGCSEEEGVGPTPTGGRCDFRPVAGSATVVAVEPAATGQVTVRYRFSSPDRRPEHPALLYENVLTQTLPCAACASALGIEPGRQVAARAQANVSGGGCAPFSIDEPWDASRCQCSTVTGPPPDPEIEYDEDGAAVELRLDAAHTIRVIGRSWQIVAVDAEGTEHMLWDYPPGGALACSACGASRGMMSPPSDHPIQMTSETFFAVLGPRPGYSTTARCSDGLPCATSRALPPGRYQLVVRGNTFACDPASFDVPVQASARVACRLLGE